MIIKVSDFISSFLVDKGIDCCFMVTGGGAMHLNNSLGKQKGMKCYCNHHEQASAIAAEGYAKVSGKPSVVCVTSGPGAINALNGVVGAYQDSIPMIVLSGQTKSSLLSKTSGLNLRTLGNQEFDIVSTLTHICKYSETLLDANMIEYCLEKALYISQSGRPGPCWIDLPLDIQGTYVDTKKLVKFDKKTYRDDESIVDDDKMMKSKIKILVDKIKTSKRPIIYAGAGIRIANAQKELLKLCKIIDVPVVTCWDSIDLIENDNDLYCGRAGTMGDRAGNFAVQNSDLLICIGTRLNIYQVGYNKNTWAKKAYVVVNDICSEELKKPTLHIDMSICCDCRLFMNILSEKLKGNVFNNFKWKKICNDWKRKYKVINENRAKTDKVNIYELMDRISLSLPNNAITVVSNGSASVVGSQTYNIRGKQRFIMNCGLSSMGYGLPAAIGACIANRRKNIICIEGDGSLQMNIQELQTVVTNKLPIKIFVINNNGYHQIRLTQKNIFNKDKLIGVGPDSKDLSFPNLKKIAYAYGYEYVSISNNRELNFKINKVLNHKGFCICEVKCGSHYIFKPKSSTKKMKDGSLYSPPLEDLYPFLPKDELDSNMFLED